MGRTRLVNRRIRLRLGRWRHQPTLATVAAGSLLVAMGLLTLGLAAAGPGMTGGWQARLAGWLDHTRAVTLDPLGWLPGAMSTGLVFAALVGVLALAWRQRRAHTITNRDQGQPSDVPPDLTTGTLTTAAEPAAMTDVEPTR